ncbi:hypothetical protein [Ferrimonas balearica]|uniref:hypothetical protein n=1 Tax=Ferrimonas balearica TaxID=44012 RepID=UPI001C99ECBC|nr:hypothetical protein [Ferrimonas balearica]MBY5990501.1 hypothetical protein [Ferrimonas balearica]
MTRIDKRQLLPVEQFTSMHDGQPYQDPHKWAQTLRTSVEWLCDDLGLPSNPSWEVEYALTPEVQHKLGEAFDILERINHWFEGDVARAWLWFRDENIAGFGNLTPAQVLKERAPLGHQWLLDYISDKESGGFE